MKARLIALLLAALLFALPLTGAHAEYSARELRRLQGLLGSYAIQSVVQTEEGVEIGVSDISDANTRQIMAAIAAMGISTDGVTLFSEDAPEDSDWAADYAQEATPEPTAAPKSAEPPADACYAGFFDYYYHAHPKCALAGTVAPVDRDEAERQGKYPCPVCVDDDAKYKGVQSTVRGGTLVIRVPDQWMLDRPAEETEDNFDYRYDAYADDFFDGAGLAEMARQLHGAAYRDLLTEWEAYDAARQADESPSEILSLAPEPAHAREPGIAPAENGLLMHQRHVGGAWYLVYRPGDADRKRLSKDGKLAVDLYFTINTLRAEGTVYADDPERRGFALNVYPGGLWQNLGHLTTLKPKKSKNKTDFEASSENEPDGSSLKLTVYRDMDANICVLHQSPASPEALIEARLLIDGLDAGIALAGYSDGEDGIYCCVLTDAEVNALKNGAPFALSFPDVAAPAPDASSDLAAMIEAGFERAFSSGD